LDRIPSFEQAEALNVNLDIVEAVALGHKATSGFLCEIWPKISVRPE
jgi:hypothetical protein